MDFQNERLPVVEIHDLWRSHAGDDPLAMASVLLVLLTHSAIYMALLGVYSAFHLFGFLGRLTGSSLSPFQRCKGRTLDCSTRNERSMKPSPT